MRIRKERLESAITKCLDIVNSSKLSREEIILLLGQLLTRAGYSFYFNYEEKDKEKPEGLITAQQAEELYFSNPTTGTTLMKAGFDLQNALLHVERE